MSEYQYYEFLAIDRPLTDQQQAEVRALSTRAHITATSFTNEYHWGDFHGDPSRMVERYYDAHLYLANWGTHRIMLRLPKAVLDPKQAERYRAESRRLGRRDGLRGLRLGHREVGRERFDQGQQDGIVPGQRGGAVIVALGALGSGGGRGWGRASCQRQEGRSGQQRTAGRGGLPEGHG
ncbi:hypothetical protein GCM10009850_092830 [Nonomuraea monospora]|uniref:Uncharacterized protein n=1 Tax=Nonomuraea monospora TaxID=568818 RepID=A0ABN3CWD7_9ACTN